MQISVVIPTCNRKQRLMQLLEYLNNSIYPVYEIIIVDSSDEPLQPNDYLFFQKGKIVYLHSERSVCVQRNIGIKSAKSEWVFLCDDDIEVPADYLQKLNEHILIHPEAGAVSGLVLQQENGEWKANYPIIKARILIWKYIFQLSIWGDIKFPDKNFIVKRVKKYYLRKGNHISKAGWPVITDFSGNYFTTPIYGLGVSLVKKEWLLNNLYDEILDRYGIGDNYGVAIQFPIPIHVVNSAFVYHHHEQLNRLQLPLQYYRRVLALDYFIKIKKKFLPQVTMTKLLWSLFGNLLSFILTKNKPMIKPTFKAMRQIFLRSNPYYQGKKKNKKVIEPLL